MSHGPLMLDLQGVELTNQERGIAVASSRRRGHSFRRNFETPDQLNRLVSIHALQRTQAAFVAVVDQEGVKVQRFCEGFTRLPPAAWFGRLYDDNPHFALEAVQSIWLVNGFGELLAEGVDFSFAPVLILALV